MLTRRGSPLPRLTIYPAPKRDRHGGRNLAATRGL